MNETNISWLRDGEVASISTNDPRLIEQPEKTPQPPGWYTDITELAAGRTGRLGKSASIL